MLLVIELIFLAAGLWALVSGRLPAGALRLLFGKGEYSLPPAQSRWYGLLLASPLPATFVVSFLVALLLGEDAAALAIGFEYIYLALVTISSIVIARRIRRAPEPPPQQPGAEVLTPQHKPAGYGGRLLIVFGLVVLSCMIFGGIGTLLMTISATIAGNTPPNALPFILPTVIIIAALVGCLQLLKLLRA